MTTRHRATIGVGAVSRAVLADAPAPAPTGVAGRKDPRETKRVRLKLLAKV